VPEASHHPEPHPVRPLASSGRRALAASVLTIAAHVPPVCASQLVDALDAASWAVLGSAGLTPLEAHALLGALWVEPTASS
jgi:hypothetical protein